MTIKEMHSAFRVLGQQMGMQLNRGILKESIDVFLNDVIIEFTQQKLVQNVHTALTEQVNTQASTMEDINTFSSLFKNARYNIDVSNVGNNNIVEYYNANNGYCVLNIPIENSSINVDNKINPLKYLGFSVEYEDNNRGNATPCRLIGSDVLDVTLRDKCNEADKNNPIICLTNNQLELFVNTENCSIKHINIKYIKVPNIVKFSDNPEECVDCDLPISTHYNIVEKAVNKFHQAIGVAK